MFYVFCPAGQLIGKYRDERVPLKHHRYRPAYYNPGNPRCWSPWQPERPDVVAEFLIDTRPDEDHRDERFVPHEFKKKRRKANA